jgi:hypothetical protein
MSFADKTRRKVINLGSVAKGTTNPISFEIPKTGLLAGIFINITGTVAGVIAAPNPLGKACIVRRVRLLANAGLNLIDISGPEYHYLLRDYIDGYADPAVSSDARSAVAAAAFDVSMYLPVAYNSRDPLGLVLLQNEQTQLILQVEFEADATVDPAAVVTATVQPFIELFTVPPKAEDMPPLNTAHTIIGDERVVAGAGDYEYKWPRGNTYVQVLHGLGMAVAGADGFSAARYVINQSDLIEGIYTPNELDLAFEKSHGRTRLPGTVAFDFAGTSGLGMFGSARDLVYSQMVTDISSIITATGAGTLYTVRRQLVSLG